MKPDLFQDFSSRYIGLCGWLSAAFGFSVLVGWVADLPLLTSFSSGSPPLAVGAALGLVFCGCALPAYTSNHRRLLFGCSLAAVLLGVVALVEHIAGRPLGLQAVWNAMTNEMPAPPGAMMTLPAALSLVVSGCANLVLLKPHTSRLRQILPANLSWLAIALGAIGILSYTSRLSIEFGPNLNLQMPLPGAIAFILLGSGINVAAVHNYPFNDIHIKHMRNSVIINTTAGVLILVMVSAAIGVWPLYVRLKQGQQQELQHAARFKASEAGQFVKLAQNLARQVASRTRARVLLEQYAQGTLEAADYAAQSSRILQDALRQTSLLKGITRFDAQGTPVVSVGTPVPQVYYPAPGTEAEPAWVSRPFPVDGQLCLIAGAPISAENGIRLGTDLLLLSGRPVSEILQHSFESGWLIDFKLACRSGDAFEVYAPVHGADSAPGLQVVTHDEPLALYREITDRLLQGHRAGLLIPYLSQDKLVHSAYYAVGDTDWLIIVTANIHDLYRDLQQHLLLSFGTIFLLSLFGAAGMLMLVRPITSGMIVQTEVMENNVNRATASLERELTARKTEQQATREIAEDFRRALNEAPLPIMIYTEDGEVLMVNRAWTDTSGYMLQDIPSMDQWRRIAMEPHKAPDRENPATVSETANHDDVGPIADGERTVMSKSEARLIWHFRTAPLRSRSVGRLKYVSMAVDITARKAAEEELNRFFTLSLEMLCIFGFDGFFKRVNPAFTEVLGYSEQDLLRTPMIEFVHPDDRENTRRELQRLISGEATQNIENRYRNKQGAYRWLLWSSHPVQDDQVIYAAARDITETREATEKIQRTMEALEHSNEELEKFAYVASHDLQEPLRTVGSFTQLLERNYRGRLDAEADEYIDFIRNGAQRAQFLINDLLEFSRVGTRHKDHTPVDCNRLLENLRDNMHLAIEECQAELIVNELPVVMGDETQLNQVFQNLISNALKFRQEAIPPRIEIAAHRKKIDWVFSVRDNGIGMEEEYYERIFTIFQRLHGEQFPGTGLGLAICKKIIEQHEGKLWVDSKIGQGTTFYFTLPFANLPAERPAVS